MENVKKALKGLGIKYYECKNKLKVFCDYDVAEDDIIVLVSKDIIFNDNGDVVSVEISKEKKPIIK